MLSTAFGEVSILHSFETTGAYIEGSLIYDNGTLYGVASSTSSPKSGGLVFSYDLSGGGYTILHQFPSSTTNEGPSWLPSNSVTVIGNQLFGSTFYGGSGMGTIYSLDINGSNFQTIHELAPQAVEGQFPNSALVSNSGKYTARHSGHLLGEELFFRSIPTAATIRCFIYFERLVTEKLRRGV
jgi:uncharacterized repeat protein (TIGR03803 family)